MAWTFLATLGRSRLIRTSFVWLLIVPVAARLLAPLRESLGDNHTFEVFGRELDVYIGLPFSWKLFYASAWILTAATLCYERWCPPLIKAFKGDRMAAALAPVDSLERYAVDLIDDGSYGPLPPPHELYDRADTSRPRAQAWCLILYIGGIGLIAFVMLQGLWDVVPLLLPAWSGAD